VVEVYNPSYLEGGRRISSLGPVQAKLVRPCLKSERPGDMD
jgi:hypothetical protein